MDTTELLRMFGEAPIPTWFGARLEFAPDRTAIVTLPGRGEFTQSTGVVHGAVITFAADTSAYFTAAAVSERGVTTADFNLHLLRPLPAGCGLYATSSIIKAGRRLIVVRAQVFNPSSTLVAEGTWSHAAQ